MQERYKTVDDSAPASIDGQAPKEIIDSFYDAVRRCQLVELYQDFVKAGQGVDGTIAYSMVNGIINERSYQWFVRNENAGHRKSLPRIGETLPSY